MPIPPPEVRSDDTVILFMGSTGSGMSNFINKLTGMSKEPDADDLDHYMRSVAAYPCTRANERFIFVDTPGFDSKHYSSLPEVLEVVAEWLEQYANSFCNKLLGLIDDETGADRMFIFLVLSTPVK
ncbi:hypothetical protein ID866_6425 [Astraeus odoratus]|nr:hypothetical protein ID866_6425 [Astraeus odoratus]